jgi:hypothetical protein
MISLSIIKIKLLAILSMVFMGLFSRFVLGFPMLLPQSHPIFSGRLETHQFPDSGNRTSLRFLPASRSCQKRKKSHKNGKMLEEEITLFQPNSYDSNFDFMGEVSSSSQ